MSTVVYLAVLLGTFVYQFEDTRLVKLIGEVLKSHGFIDPRTAAAKKANAWLLGHWHCKKTSQTVDFYTNAKGSGKMVCINCKGESFMPEVRKLLKERKATEKAQISVDAAVLFLLATMGCILLWFALAAVFSALGLEMTQP